MSRQPDRIASGQDACYRYSRHVPGAHDILTGTGIEHLRESVASINAPPLPAPVIAKLDRVLARMTKFSGDWGMTP